MDRTGGYRAAFVISLFIAFASGGLLVQNNVGSEEQAVARGGTTLAQRQLQDLSISTPTPTPVSTGQSHSAAVLSAPEHAGSSATAVADRLPPFGRYTYSVEGTESGPPFGSRDYPPEVTMVVSRPDDVDLRKNEVVFDLPFSPEHTERKIVQYRTSGVSFSFESQSITFGPGASQQDESTLRPPVLQVPFPLKSGSVETGDSTAEASSGEETRTERWSVGVLRQENLNVLGRNFKTWVIRAERTSEPGSTQSMHRTRTYWYSPEGNIWLKWTEDATSSRSGFGAVDYSSQYTATLASFEAA